MTGKILQNSVDNPQQQALLTLDRRRKIAEQLEKAGNVRVLELAKLHGVSEVTIRKDLDVMARDGLLVRSHGGAVAKTYTHQSTDYDLRAHQNLPAKQRIAKAALEMIRPGETIIIDAGTTMMELAKMIPADLQLTVITNALNIASYLMMAPKRHVIVTGGSVSPEIIGTLGPLAEQHLGTLVADKLFLSAQAVDFGMGVTDVSPDVARVKQAMIASAREVILLADSSKWRQTATARVTPLGTLDAFITDEGMPLAEARMLAKTGLQIVRV